MKEHSIRAKYTRGSNNLIDQVDFDSNKTKGYSADCVYPLQHTMGYIEPYSGLEHEMFSKFSTVKQSIQAIKEQEPIELNFED